MEVVLVSHNLDEALSFADHLEEEGFDWSFSLVGQLASLAYPTAMPAFTIVVAADQAAEARWLLYNIQEG